MASDDLRQKMKYAVRDLGTVMNSPNFVRIRNSSVLLDPWTDSKDLAIAWVRKADPVLDSIDDSSLQPLEIFVRRIVDIGDGREVRQNESIIDAIRRVKGDFISARTLLGFEILEAGGIFDVSKENFSKWRNDVVAEVQEAVSTAKDDVDRILANADLSLKASAKQAGEEFEFLKAEASKISVVQARDQFDAAAGVLKKKSEIWMVVTISLFFVLAVYLAIWIPYHPPALIAEIVAAMDPGLVKPRPPLPVSVPLLLAASAYYTSARLALVGLLGIGFAFGLRMTRAYLHMIEHNQHKLRVTNSIEAFVAAVRTQEQKDLVLGKLVESVTEFGDSGILGKEEKPSGLPSVIFEAMTKNIGKND